MTMWTGIAAPLGNPSTQGETRTQRPITKFSHSSQTAKAAKAAIDIAAMITPLQGRSLWPRYIFRRGEPTCAGTEVSCGEFVANLRRPRPDILKAIVAHLWTSPLEALQPH